MPSMNLRREVVLPAKITPHDPAPTAAGGADVLVTGGTGYLGKHLIADLLQNSPGKIHCLVRASSEHEARQRLTHNLRTIGIEVPADSRIAVVVGDVSRPQLGLDAADYDRLASEIGTVYHSGASVSFAQTYEEISPANVAGTRNVLQFACERQTKFVHHVSTYAVFNGRHYRGSTRVAERPLDDDGEGLVRGYGQSKWVAEGLCELARLRGLPVNIYRAGIVSGDSRSGQCNSSDTMSLTMLAVLRMQAAMDTDFLLHLTPVDFCSRAIVELSRRIQGTGGTYHLVNPQPVAWQAWVAWLQRRGPAVRQLPPHEWYQLLKRTCAQHPVLLPLVLLLNHDPNRNFWNDSNIFRMQFDDTSVRRDLAGTGLNCPPVDAQLLETYWQFLLRAGDSWFDGRWSGRPRPAAAVRPLSPSVAAVEVRA